MRVLSRMCLAFGMVCAILSMTSCGGGMGSGTPTPAPKPSTVAVTLAGSGTGTVTSSPAGISCGTACTANFADGAITLTATAASGSTFTGWSGACTGTTATCAIPAGSTAAATATFGATGPANITVTLAGAGTGTVTSNPAGITCGTTCTGSFASGNVTLTEAPTSGSSFTGWSGACSGTTATCVIPAGSTANVTATFGSAGATSNITVALSGTGTGTVTSSPAGISCGTTCTASFTGDVTLTATPGSSFAITGWNGGGCSGMPATCVIPAGSTANVTVTFSATLNSINHIIVLLQENRSFDHYFGKMNEYRQNNAIPIVVDSGAASVNVAPANASNPTFDQTGTITSFHMLSMCVENPSPFWNEAHRDYNLSNPVSTTALNNGFVTAAADDSMQNMPPGNDLTGTRAMGYYDNNDLPFYYFMASNFAMSDSWFSPVLDRTQPNRMYMVAATSDGHVHPLDPGVRSSRKTIFEELDAAHITWKIYVPAGSPTLVDSTEMAMFDYGPTHPNNFVLSSTFAADAAAGTLPQVAYIAEGQGTDEHPAALGGGAGGSVQFGSNYVQDNYILPLLASPSSWKDSVFILLWDENGGFYDHVAPYKTVAPDAVAPSDLEPSDICFGVAPSASNICGFDRTGFRVPMMLISPYAKKNFVSHSQADHTAVLKLIETRFGVPSLTARDAAQIDMTEFFDFINAPWMTPPSPPAQQTDGPCYINTLP